MTFLFNLYLYLEKAAFLINFNYSVFKLQFICLKTLNTQLLHNVDVD